MKTEILNASKQLTTCAMPHPASVHIEENLRIVQELFGESADIKIKEMRLGRGQGVRCAVVFIEITAGTLLFEQSLVGKLLNGMEAFSAEDIRRCLQENGRGLCDVTIFDNVEDAVQYGLLTGDVLLFVDGLDGILKIPDKGYPNMGVTKPESEKVIRGSGEGFADSVKVNTALLRKRVRSSKLHVKELTSGQYTHTPVDIVYMEDLVSPNLLAQIEGRLEGFVIDGVMDSGMLEQLAEEAWYSPFPQFQTTQRPDRAAQALLEGRVVVLCDNSPEALLAPTDFNSLLKTSDDYYNRFQIASFERMIRYAAAFFALSFPAFYLSVTNFHSQVLPTSLLLSFAAARQGVPFPALIEVLLMELSFELLREAGVRLPGAMGNTIGIVGGLIIGQAAVEANLVSPIVVIIVAFTALCSFAIPNEELSTAFRILKFFMIICAAWLGLFGYLASLLVILLHLAGLRSFGNPYLSPFVAGTSGSADGRDSIVRYPFHKLTRRPQYAREGMRRRMWFGSHKQKGKEK